LEYLSQDTLSKTLPLFLSEGHWFVSLYNDYGDSQEIGLTVAPSRELTEGCPSGCNGRGRCQLGRCVCEAGFGGDDCSQGESVDLVHKMSLPTSFSSLSSVHAGGRLA